MSQNIMRVHEDKEKKRKETKRPKYKSLNKRKNTASPSPPEGNPSTGRIHDRSALIRVRRLDCRERQEHTMYQRTTEARWRSREQAPGPLPLPSHSRTSRSPTCTCRTDSGRNRPEGKAIGWAGLAVIAARRPQAQTGARPEFDFEPPAGVEVWTACLAGTCRSVPALVLGNCHGPAGRLTWVLPAREPWYSRPRRIL